MVQEFWEDHNTSSNDLIIYNNYEYTSLMLYLFLTPSAYKKY